MKQFALPSLLLLVIGCAAPTEGPDAGDAPPISEPACSTSAPCALSLNTPTQGTIGVVGQVHLYTVTVGQEHEGRRPIIQVQVELPSVSVVRPVFTLVAANDQVMGTRGPSETPNPSRLSANLLVPGPGTYELFIRDADGHAADPRHPYSVATSVIDDPDLSEPDDDPAHARTTTSGFIASTGDRDLVSFSMPAAGLAHLLVDQAEAGGALRLRARLLKRSSSTPNDLANAMALAEYAAARAGAALHVDVIRLLAAGDYVLEMSDATGANADAQPAAQWSVAISEASEPDAQDQGTQRNDTEATATTIAASGSTVLQGVIGSQGDRDWFHIALPSTATARLVEIGIDPQQANSEVQLLWAVGTRLAQPAGACDANCGPTLFCASNRCGYTLHALRDYSSGDTTRQVVRLHQQGPAQDIYVLVQDQGDDDRTTLPYGLRVSILPDPDPNEPGVSNDSIAGATSLSAMSNPDGSTRYQGSGMISWWDYVDGRGTFQEPDDVDWFALPLPPRIACDPSVDAGSPCTASPDGGPSFLPAPDYGLTMHWRGPTDGTYRIGLQGMASIGNGERACLFSFDERNAHSETGGYVLGNNASDPCFCLPSAAAGNETMWVRIDGPHRPDPPAANAYSDQPYSFQLDLVPGVLQPACAGACPSITRASSCP